MSDRFFLNSIGSDRISEYLFDRSQFIQKILTEELCQCAILSTYGFNVEHSQKELANLIGIDSKVPTLILHGDKGKILNETSLLRKNEHEYKEKESVSEQQSQGISRLTSTSVEECCRVRNFHSTSTKNDAESIHVKSNSCVIKNAQSKPDSCKLFKPDAEINHLLESLETEERFQHSSETSNAEFSLKGLHTYPANVFIERIVPQWSVQTTAVGSSSRSSSSGCSSIKSTNRKNYMMGVHHPKYILLFTDKGLHVVISTSNLTPNVSAEGSWRDFFPRRSHFGVNDKEEYISPLNDGNNFGIVLQDFLQKQSEQIFKPMTEDEKTGGCPLLFHEPVSFIKKYAGVECLSTSYDFSLAQVDLVTSVPGCTPLVSPTDKEITSLYALQRRADKARNERTQQGVKHRIKNNKRKNSNNHKTSKMRNIIDDRKDSSDNKVFINRNCLDSNYDVERSEVDDDNAIDINGQSNNKNGDNNDKNVENRRKCEAPIIMNYDLKNSILSLGPKCGLCLHHDVRLGLGLQVEPGARRELQKGGEIGLEMDLKIANHKEKSSIKIKVASAEKEEEEKNSTENKISLGVEVGDKVLYGLQRCREVLLKNSILLPRALTHRDSLMIQPTSISSGIKTSYIGYFLSHFMPENSWRKTYQEHEVLPVECCRVIWPKSSFMRDCATRKEESKAIYILSQSQKTSSQSKEDDTFNEDSVNIKDVDSTQRSESFRDGDLCAKNVNISNNSSDEINRIDRNVNDVEDMCLLNRIPYSSQLSKHLDNAPISTLNFQNGKTPNLHHQSKLLHKQEKRDMGRREHATAGYKYSDDDAGADAEGPNPHSLDDEEEAGTGLFLQMKSLALMELDVQSRLYTYEPNEAEAIGFPRDVSPHIKSYTRLMVPISVSVHTPPSISSGDVCIPEYPCGDKISKDNKALKENMDILSDSNGEGKWKNEEEKHVGRVECICYTLAWTLITSSCLSRGAHGKEVPHSLCTDCHHIRHGYVEILNFEIGVVFHSRPGKEYRALNPMCPLHSGSNDGKNDNRNDIGDSMNSSNDMRDDLDSRQSKVEMLTNNHRVKKDSQIPVPAPLALHDPMVVILPFPYDILGGVPYCLDGTSTFRHRPFISDTKAEVASYTTNQMDLPPASPSSSGSGSRSGDSGDYLYHDNSSSKNDLDDNIEKSNGNTKIFPQVETQVTADATGIIRKTEQIYEMRAEESIAENESIEEFRHHLVSNKKKEYIYYEGNEKKSYDLPTIQTPPSDRKECCEVSCIKEHRGHMAESPCFATDFLCEI